MKQILNTLFLLFIAVTSYAAKASAPAQTVILQDGRTVTVNLVGDERLHFFLTDDGEVVLCQDGTFHAATQAEKDSLTALATVIEAEREAQISAITSGKSIMSGEGIHETHACPHSGKVRIPVIMVEFTDTVFRYKKSDVDRLLNSTETQQAATFDSQKPWGSAAEYFRFCSSGQLDLQFDVYGPYKLSNKVSYYAKGGETVMISEALALAKKDIDFSKYDSDDDGDVDAINIFYAGWNQNQSGNTNDIWPKSSTGNFGTFNGVKINRWGIQGELLGSPKIKDYWNGGNPRFTGHGILLHEFCHNLGLPDFYPTSSWDKKAKVEWFDNQSMERWDLMDDGENISAGLFPVPLSAFERELFGWNKLDTLDAPANVHLMPFIHGGNGLRILNDNDISGNEYYILEALPASRQSGWYVSVPASGLLITHVNYSISDFKTLGHPNNNHGTPRITIMPADGYLPSSYRLQIEATDVYSHKRLTSEEYVNELKGDVYPGSKNVTSFTDYKAYIGTIDKPITNIVRNSDYSISFKFMGGEDISTVKGDVDYNIGGLNYIAKDVEYTIKRYTVDNVEKMDITVGGTSLNSTPIGDLTMGSFTVKGLVMDAGKGGFYRNYTNDNISIHFKAVNGGVTTFDNDYIMGATSDILVKYNGDTVSDIINNYQPGRMPFGVITDYPSQGTDIMVATGMKPKATIKIWDGRQVSIEKDSRKYSADGK